MRELQAILLEFIKDPCNLSQEPKDGLVVSIETSKTINDPRFRIKARSI